MYSFPIKKVHALIMHPQLPSAGLSQSCNLNYFSKVDIFSEIHNVESQVYHLLSDPCLLTLAVFYAVDHVCKFSL